jgi:hypothetical protein
MNDSCCRQKGVDGCTCTVGRQRTPECGDSKVYTQNPCGKPDFDLVHPGFEGQTTDDVLAFAIRDTLPKLAYRQDTLRRAYGSCPTLLFARPAESGVTVGAPEPIVSPSVPAVLLLGWFVTQMLPEPSLATAFGLAGCRC